MNNKQYRLSNIYKQMVNRTTSIKNKSYKTYGGRNIKVCDEWLNNFESFYDWAINNGYKDNLTIDRIDNDKGYNPENCRWVTKAFNSAHTKKCKKNISPEAEKYNSNERRYNFVPKDKLKQFRKKTGLTQEEMAKMFNLTRATWCNIERGRNTGTAEMWIELGTKFNLTLEELKALMEVS